MRCIAGDDSLLRLERGAIRLGLTRVFGLVVNDEEVPIAGKALVIARVFGLQIVESHGSMAWQALVS